MENMPQHTLIGPYWWGGDIDSNDKVSVGLSRSKMLNSKIIRIYLGCEFDKKYKGIEYSNKTTPENSLTDLAKRPEVAKILSDSQYEVIVITGYDWKSLPGLPSWGREYKKFLQPDWFDSTTNNQSNNELVINEWCEFATHLKNTYPNKKFILCTWEGDNQCWEDGAWNAKITDQGNENVKGYTKWIQARTQGIHKAKPKNVFSAVEMTSLNHLTENGGLSVLNYVVKNVPALDYLSYSMWESKYRDKFSADIDFIRNTLNDNGNANKPTLFIGEVGYSCYERDNHGLVKIPDINYATQKLNNFIAVMNQKNIPYGLVWNLFPMNDGKGANDYYSIDKFGKISPYGDIYSNK